jgi:hypothetical protein
LSVSGSLTGASILEHFQSDNTLAAAGRVGLHQVLSFPSLACSSSSRRASRARYRSSDNVLPHCACVFFLDSMVCSRVATNRLIPFQLNIFDQFRALFQGVTKRDGLWVPDHTTNRWTCYGLSCPPCHFSSASRCPRFQIPSLQLPLPAPPRTIYLKTTNPNDGAGIRPLAINICTHASPQAQLPQWLPRPAREVGSPLMHRRLRVRVSRR